METKSLTSFEHLKQMDEEEVSTQNMGSNDQIQEATVGEFRSVGRMPKQDNNKQPSFKEKRERGDDFKSLEPETKTNFEMKTFAGDNTVKNSQSGKHDFDILLGGEKVNAAQFVSRLRMNTASRRAPRGLGKKKGIKALTLFQQSSFGSQQNNQS